MQPTTYIKNDGVDISSLHAMLIVMCDHMLWQNSHIQTIERFHKDVSSLSFCRPPVGDYRVFPPSPRCDQLSSPRWKHRTSHCQNNCTCSLKATSLAAPAELVVKHPTVGWNFLFLKKITIINANFQELLVAFLRGRFARLQAVTVLTIPFVG